MKRFGICGLLAVCLLGPVPAALGAGLSAERQRYLDDLLHEDCGACHGMTLKGGLGPPLLPERLRRLPREFLAATILNGRPGTPMPPWRPFLSRSDVDWILDRLLRADQP